MERTNCCHRLCSVLLRYLRTIIPFRFSVSKRYHSPEQSNYSIFGRRVVRKTRQIHRSFSLHRIRQLRYPSNSLLSFRRTRIITKTTRQSYALCLLLSLKQNTWRKRPCSSCSYKICVLTSSALEV